MTRLEGARAATAIALRYALPAAAGAYLLVYVVVAGLRLGYPFELEWMEGGSLQHVARVLEGRGLYVAPRLDFIPYEYPPLYFWVSALVARVTGLGFLPLRAVSLVSSIACFAALFALVRFETGSRAGGMAAAGLFAATYRIGGAWLDVARVDSLFLALFLLALLVLQRARSARPLVLAGLLFGLSCLTKQTALAMCLPPVALVMLSTPRRGAWLGGSLAAVVVISTALLQWASGGWYSFYVLRFPFLHPWIRSVYVSFWTGDVLSHLPVAVAAGLLGLALLPSRERSLFWLAVTVGMVGGAYRSRLQAGGYDNVLLPAYAAIAILFGLALATLGRRLEGWEPRRGMAAQIAVHGLGLAQFALLAYDPRLDVPGTADRQAGEQVLATLADVDGDVLVPYHGYLAARAGGRAYAHAMQVFDVLKVGLPESEALAEEHRAAIRARRFRAIVIDEPESYFFMPELEAAYVRERELFTDPAVFFPVTGMRTRPQYVYVPR